jgi:hypothetical protein
MASMSSVLKDSPGGFRVNDPAMDMAIQEANLDDSDLRLDVSRVPPFTETPDAILDVIDGGFQTKIALGL